MFGHLLELSSQISYFTIYSVLRGRLALGYVETTISARFCFIMNDIPV